ncbi:MAG TPA: extracellular solute-binding protein [Acholeplasmataceae bacterium]|nr:extracellular solute-binding protein [Acholeplasmataceae bacterium]
MKKIFTILSVIILAVVLIACDSRPRLKVFMPTEYISEDLLDKLHKNSEYKVDIITFDSNEDMLSKYATGSYDLIIPSDYALEELVAKGAVQKIDWTRLTTFNKSNIDSELMGAFTQLENAETPFTLLDYGVPYFWGSIGILYDTTKINQTLIETEGWDILNSGRDLMMYNSARDAVMIALKQIYADREDTTSSVNTPTNTDLALAETWLTNIKGPKTLIATDEVFDLMLKPTQVDLAISYSGDAVYLMDENENLEYFVPNTGSNIFIDAIVITKDTKNLDFAYDFINFLLEEDNAYLNSVDTAYTSPRSDVINEIIEKGVYPESSYRVSFRENDEIFRYNQTLNTELINIWQRVLAN